MSIISSTATAQENHSNNRVPIDPGIGFIHLGCHMGTSTLRTLLKDHANAPGYVEEKVQCEKNRENV
jgi:hypothetical protein